MVRTKLTFFAGKSHFLAEEYVNANDVTAFCRYFMNKMKSLKNSTYDLPSHFINKIKTKGYDVIGVNR